MNDEEAINHAVKIAQALVPFYLALGCHEQQAVGVSVPQACRIVCNEIDKWPDSGKVLDLVKEGLSK